MKTDINLVKENIYNLTSLWETAGAPFLCNHKTEWFQYCNIENSDWPNKLWFSEDITENSVVKALEVFKTKKNLVIPYWDIYQNNSSEILEKHNFKIKSEQTAMFLKLEKTFDELYKLNYKRVLNEKDAEIWTSIYPTAFRYRIGKEILLQQFSNLQFHLVYLEEKPIGTFMLFQTQNNIGIHGLGIIPEMRKRGYAEEIMKFILNYAIDSKIDYALLQASAMGKDIYTRLGFEDLFAIKNYTLSDS